MTQPAGRFLVTVYLLPLYWSCAREETGWSLGILCAGRKVRTPWAGRWVTPRRSNPTPAPQKTNRRWPMRRDPF